jgi:hypothetical protein
MPGVGCVTQPTRFAERIKRSKVRFFDDREFLSFLELHRIAPGHGSSARKRASVPVSGTPVTASGRQ